MQKAIMRRSNQFFVESKINVNTMARELTNVEKDCHIGLVRDHGGHLVQAGADPASKVRGGGAISVKFDIQVSLRLHYCKT